MSEQEKIKVLLAEDHALTRIGLKTVLSRTSDIVVIGEAENGQDAIDKVQALSPDVVLMDVGMPVMDGIEAAGKLKVSHPHVNIIMLTSHDNDSDIFASLSAGAGGYCLKDVLPERLYTAIRSVNAGDIWLDSSIASRVVRLYSGSGAAGPSSSTSNIGHSGGSIGTGSSDHGVSVNGTGSGAANVGSSFAGSERSSAEAGQPSRDNASTSTFAHHAAMPELPEPLSPRELEVLSLLVEGLSNQQIADRLIISLATAKTHVRNILNKLAVDDRTQAAVQAMRRGLV
ncbi:MAG: response regulator transcription factor [Candidatus Obscuribacterales bacterium]|nr:response regulator transcription factor [Candidatus Obscuribacterales bacterium]